MRKASEAFGAEVARVIKEHGLTQAQASIKTGVDRFTLGQMIQGVVPRMERVLDFANGFGLDPNDWLELAGFERLDTPLGYYHRHVNPVYELCQELGLEFIEPDFEGGERVQAAKGYERARHMIREAIEDQARRYPEHAERFQALLKGDG